MKLYCPKCKKENKIQLRKVGEYFSKAFCVECRQGVKYLDADEYMQYKQEINPDWKRSTDRVLGPAAGLGVFPFI